MLTDIVSDDAINYSEYSRRINFCMYKPIPILSVIKFYYHNSEILQSFKIYNEFDMFFLKEMQEYYTVSFKFCVTQMVGITLVLLYELKCFYRKKKMEDLI